MKLNHSKGAGERGNTLIIVIILGCCMLIGLVSYIQLLSNHKKLVNRSQDWNAAITMAEAGIEEGLAQANSITNIFFQTNTTDFSVNGWGVANGIYGPVTRNLAGGNYSVAIIGGTSPTILSTGYVTVPISGSAISRKIRVTTQQLGLINVPVGAVSNILFNGNGVATDSYNSHSTNLSTGGLYDSTKTSTNGSVASQAGLVDFGQHTIDGNLYLGPDATFDDNGTVTGTTNYDANISFPDVTLPNGANNWPTAGITTTTTTTTGKNGKTTTTSTSAYDFTASGNYILADTSYPIVVEAGVTVNLNVTAVTFNPSSLTIHGGMTNSGTAKFFLDGPISVSIAGNTAVDASNRPENLWYFGLSSLQNITWSGTSSFVGVIYAPDSVLTLNGGGNNNGVIGAAIARQITMNGHYNFHYDESLATNGPVRGYVANSWQEL